MANISKLKVNGTTYDIAATKLNNRGNQTAITAKEEAGMYLNQVYNNGYPCSYGNVVTVGGDGGGQLLLGWSDTDKAIAPLYYRNRRDVSEGWSEWRQIAFTTDLVPAGTMQMFAGNTIPAGWLLCDGSAVSRTNYAKLFSAIGTTWGAGDGSTTFNLPNSIGRFAEGAATSGSYKSAGLPNIHATLTNVPLTSTGAKTSGAFALEDRVPLYLNMSGTQMCHSTLKFSAQTLYPIYGSSTTVQPNSFTVRYIIKY